MVDGTESIAQKLPGIIAACITEASTHPLNGEMTENSTMGPLSPPPQRNTQTRPRHTASKLRSICCCYAVVKRDTTVLLISI